MKVIYLAETRRDVAWWRIYYRKVFPQGGSNAYRILLASERLLQENPMAGAKVETSELRKLTIPNTPFALIYRVRNGRIEIHRLFDMRQQGSESFQED